MAVPGAGPLPQPTKRALAAAKKAAGGPALPSSKGVDPAATNVEAKAKKASALASERRSGCTDMGGRLTGGPDRLEQDDTHQSGRPDKASYDTEQDDLRRQIDALQAKSNDIKNKIAASSNKGSPHHERKLALRKELDALRAEQAGLKGGRAKTLEQVKALQENLNKKIKDLQAAKAKAPFKTVQDVEDQIKFLDRQVESGTMKLVDEKKALQEISSLKKSRKVVESFATQQAAIDADKKKVDEVRAQLDDPEQKAASAKMAELRKELDEINKKMDEQSKARDGLFEERNAISKQLDDLFTKKKASAQAFRESNNKYYEKLNAERAKREERRRTERREAEEAKRAEINQRLLEEAQAPAFEREIEDCRTLILFFQQRLGLAPPAGSAPSNGLFARAEVAGVPKLELRKVESELPKGAVPLKKKGEQEEESWGGFGGKKGKKGGNKKGAAATAADGNGEGDAPAPVADETLHLPFGTLSALMALGITAPLTTKEAPQTIENLERKKQYFVDNQDRVTKERVAAVEKKIAVALEASSSPADSMTGTASSEVEAVANAEPTALEEEVKENEPVPVEEHKAAEEVVEEAPEEEKTEQETKKEDA
ncbi:hypothetical protein JCM1841_003631 [Sporobolomyces salmonicolor]